jgi:hypothetical protein
MAAECRLIVHGLIVTFWLAAKNVDDSLQEQVNEWTPLNYLTIMTLARDALATWFGAAVIGGVLILIAERFSRNSEPSDADVKRAAIYYRQHYGEQAFIVIGDHLLAATLAPDGRHHRFLQRVSAELLANDITDEDRAGAIDI